MTPRQLGPSRRMPKRRAARSAARRQRRALGPDSANPAEMTMTALTPLRAAVLDHAGHLGRPAPRRRPGRRARRCRRRPGTARTPATWSARGLTGYTGPLKSWRQQVAQHRVADARALAAGADHRHRAGRQQQAHRLGLGPLGPGLDGGLGLGRRLQVEVDLDDARRRTCCGPRTRPAGTPPPCGWFVGSTVAVKALMPARRAATARYSSSTVAMPRPLVARRRRRTPPRPRTAAASGRSGPRPTMHVVEQGDERHAVDVVDVGEVADLVVAEARVGREVAEVDALRRLAGVEVDDARAVVGPDRPHPARCRRRTAPRRRPTRPGSRAGSAPRWWSSAGASSTRPSVTARRGRRGSPRSGPWRAGVAHPRAHRRPPASPGRRGGTCGEESLVKRTSHVPRSRSASCRCWRLRAPSEADGAASPVTGRVDGPSAPQVSDDPAAVAQRAVEDVDRLLARDLPRRSTATSSQDLAGFYPYGPDTEMPPCGPFDAGLRGDRRQRLLLPRRRHHRLGRGLAHAPAQRGLRRVHGRHRHRPRVRPRRPGPLRHRRPHGRPRAAGRLLRRGVDRDVADGRSAAGFDAGDVDLDKTVAGHDRHPRPARAPIRTTRWPTAAGSTGWRPFQDGYENGAGKCAEYADEPERPAHAEIAVPTPRTTRPRATCPSRTTGTARDPRPVLLVEQDLNEFYGWSSTSSASTWTPVERPGGRRPRHRRGDLRRRRAVGRRARVRRRSTARTRTSWCIDGAGLAGDLNEHRRLRGGRRDRTAVGHRRPRPSSACGDDDERHPPGRLPDRVLGGLDLPRRRGRDSRHRPRRSRPATSTRGSWASWPTARPATAGRHRVRAH